MSKHKIFPTFNIDKCQIIKDKYSFSAPAQAMLSASINHASSHQHNLCTVKLKIK
jgi:hypothetical protein